MLIDITANQSKVLLLLIETMTPERFPDLEVDDFTDAWAVHAQIFETRPESHDMSKTRGYVLRPKQGVQLPIRIIEASHPTQPMARVAADLYTCEVATHADYMEAQAKGVKIESAQPQQSLPV